MKYAFIVGAQKAGTTFLHNALVSDAAFCGLPEKEPHYFSSNRFGGQPYASIFPKVGKPNASVMLDSSASYLHHGEAAERIKAEGLDPLILVHTRDPVRRTVSAYLHNAKNGRDTRGWRLALALDATDPAEVFEEETQNVERGLRRGEIVLRPTYATHFGDRSYIDPFWTFRYVSNSLYAYQARRFQAAFTRVEFVEFGELVKDPIAMVNRVRAMLSLGPVSALAENLDRNETRVSSPLVARKYLRNCLYDRSKAPDLLRMSRSVLAAMLNDYDSTSIAHQTAANLAEFFATLTPPPQPSSM